uniref:J domain-containing protein n=1 Tax=Oryza nivara TaxID=4536 RepID=A0A0E0HMR5_ORYNI
MKRSILGRQPTYAVETQNLFLLPQSTIPLPSPPRRLVEAARAASGIFSNPPLLPRSSSSSSSSHSLALGTSAPRASSTRLHGPRARPAARSPRAPPPPWMGRLGWLRLASRSLALRSGEVAAQGSKWIRHSTPCSSSGIYIGDKCYGRFMLTSFTLSRSFHATGQHSSPEKDYYKILGVPKDASQEEIKRAFHSLAKRYHPDTNRGNTAAKRTFQEIRDAYEANAHANDIEVEVNLSFRDAVKGCMKQVSFSAKNLCDSCDGRGYLANAKMYICPSCRGAGRVSINPFTSICTSCRGFGKVIKDYCLTCKGSGVVDGMKYGLILAIQFMYQRLDIVVDVEPYLEAMLGGKVEVPTLDGTAEVKIPKGVQPGQVIVLRGKGLPNQAGYLGDQHVRFRIHFPSMVNERQRALLEEFAVEEATKEQSSFSAGNWWELVENMKGQTFLLGLGFLVLVHLLLTKTVN